MNHYRSPILPGTKARTETETETEKEKEIRADVDHAVLADDPHVEIPRRDVDHPLRGAGPHPHPGVGVVGLG